MTTDQASKWLEERGILLQPNTVKRHILRGNIQAEKHGRDWWITETALETFIATRRGRGKPPTAPRRPSPEAPE